MAYHYTPIAVTATSDGLTTGVIPNDAGAPGYFVSVTSANANNIITLPSSDDIPVGWTCRGYIGANGCEMRTVASSNETINGVDADGTQEAALPATTLFEVTKVAADTFILNIVDEGGDEATAPIPD